MISPQLDEPRPRCCNEHAPTAAAGQLQQELRRCQNQLRVVLDLAGALGGEQDPEALQTELLQRCGTLLQSEAVYLDRAGCCLRVAPNGANGVVPEHLRSVLTESVEQVRRDARARAAAGAVERLAGAHVLLAALPRSDGETGVVIAVRGAGAPAFEEADVRAAEEVLAFGAQVINEVLTVRHLQRTALETVGTLVNAIDAKDNYTSAHSERVGGLARLTGQTLGLDKETLQALECSGLLHDVGKIGVAEQILNKPGALTPAEFEEMKRHSQVGYDMLRPVAQFQPILGAVLHHHENHDGSGYPAGLAGANIPLGARIIHVVDIFDALTTHRPYRKAYDLELALRVIEAGAGRATDPTVTESFIQALRRHMTEHPVDFRVRFGHLEEETPAAHCVN